jgi:hypothetical protein
MSFNKLCILILIMILSGHASVLSQPIHKDSINRKMTGYYQIYYNIREFAEINEYGFLKKGKREGFWTEQHIIYLKNGSLRYSSDQGFYKNDKKVGSWLTISDYFGNNIYITNHKRFSNRYTEYIYTDSQLQYIFFHKSNRPLHKLFVYKNNRLYSQKKFIRYSKITKFEHYKVILYDSCGRTDSVIKYIEDGNLNPEVGVNNYTFKHGWCKSYDYSAGIIRKEKYVRGERVKQKESRFHYRK